MCIYFSTSKLRSHCLNVLSSCVIVSAVSGLKSFKRAVSSVFRKDFTRTSNSYATVCVLFFNLVFLVSRFIS